MLALNDVRIAVAGLGYVGLPLAVEFGKQFDVLGYGIKQDRVEELRAGEDHTLEVSSKEIAQAPRFRFSDDPDDLIWANVFLVPQSRPGSVDPVADGGGRIPEIRDHGSRTRDYERVHGIALIGSTGAEHG